MKAPSIHFYGVAVQAIYFAALYVLIRRKCKQEILKPENLIHSLLLGSVGICLLGIMQYLNYGLIVRSIQLPPSQGLWGFYLIDWIMIPIQHAHARVYSLFYAPPMYGLYLSLLLPLSLYCLQQAQSRKAQALWCLVVGLISLNLLMSFTRIAWIAAAISCLIYMLRYGSRPLWRSISGGALLLVCLSFLWPPLWQHAWQRIQSILSLTHHSNVGRLEIWSKSWQVFWQKPLTGHGFFSFASLFPQWRGLWPHSHSMLLQSLLETGLISTSLFYGFLLSCVKKWGQQPLHWACACSLLAYMICGWVDHVAFDARNVFVFWLVLAIGSLPSRQQKLTILQ